MPSENDEAIAAINGAEICHQSFGRPEDPALLLIMGSSASMDWWETGFCERLAAGGRHVVRYDHRDTGRSSSYPQGQPGYEYGDLVADAGALRDELGLERCHLVGMSMGGGIAQRLALDDPARTASLTLIAAGPAFGEPEDDGLPEMSESTIAAFSVAPPDLDDRAAVVEHLTHLARVSASPAREFEEAEFRELAGAIVDRTESIGATLDNHDALLGNVFEDGDGGRGRLADLAVPTLVIHGSDDPVLPLPYGRALAERIPGAELLVLERMGHEVPRAHWERIVPAILEHTAVR